MSRMDVVGEVYGRMTVIADAPTHPNTRMRRVIATCTCGQTKEVLLASLRNGATKSCGCLHKEITTTHGQTCANSRLYAIWNAMKDRCGNPNAQKYPYYGARGITVCSAWQSSFETFNAWAIKGYEKGLSLDRRDNDAGYSPENCRWVDKVTQSRNQRARKAGTSQYVGVHWCKTTLKWAAMIGLNGRKKHLGLYPTELAAAIARDQFIVNAQLTDFHMNNVL